MALHKAVPADPRLAQSSCLVCGDITRPVPGGNGITWVHGDGHVLSDSPALPPLSRTELSSS